MKDRLKELRGRKFIGTAQLADEAARLVSQIVPRQERQSVSLVPDERTVRYYSAEGLLAPPEGKQGLNAVYGYQHLLQLLVIKRLQAEHLPMLDHALVEKQIVAMQIDRDPERAFRGRDAGDVIDVCVRQQDMADRQRFAVGKREQLAHGVAGIDQDRFARALAADDEAVLHERTAGFDVDYHVDR